MFVLVVSLLVPSAARAQDYEREKRWADETLASLVVGDAVWLPQANGHKFLALYTEAPDAKGDAP